MSGDGRSFEVVCTGRSTHGRIAFSALTLTGGGEIQQAKHRTGASPVAGSVDGVRVHHRAVLPAASHRAANGTWRWKCPRCGIDRPLTGQRLRLWMQATHGDILDISLLPR